MPFVLFVFLQALQAIYSFIMGQLAIPQWINPLRPSDPPDLFSAAFILQFGGRQSDTTPSVLFTVVFVLLFPFIGVHIVDCLCSLIEETRDLAVWQLDGFVAQYLAEKFLPFKRSRSRGRNEWEAKSLIPRVPLQMPGPATNPLVLSVACHPRSDEVGTSISHKRVKRGVVQEPKGVSGYSKPRDTRFDSLAPVTPPRKPNISTISENSSSPAFENKSQPASMVTSTLS